MKVKRDVSCTSTLHYSELRGAEPNPLDFRTAMEEIRGKTASLFLSLPHACYSSPVLWRLILMCVEILICFNMKRLRKWAHGYITEMTWAQTQRKCPTGRGFSDLQQPSGCFPAQIQHVQDETATNYWSCDWIYLILTRVNVNRRQYLRELCIRLHLRDK